MAKKWKDLKVGDKLIAVADGMHVTKGRIYEVEDVYSNRVSFINDGGRYHSATEEWVLIPHEENEKGDGKMAKFKVGDKVIALRDDIDITKGNVYEVIDICDDGDIRIVDDVKDSNVVAGTWFEPYEEPIKANGILNVEVNVDALHTTPNVYPGQVRMSTDGFVILVIHPIYGLDEEETEGHFNSIILHDPLDGELDFECNLPVRNQSGDDIADEYPIVVDAKLTIDKISGGNA